jgi:demethylmenaquinone methyltransferase/2-methoxy-6-polyprenyl-1,4-benzoquinol methylase
MNELDALLAEQVAYYRALAPEYLEDAGIEGVTEETQDTTERAILAALDNAAPLGDVLELACGPGSFTTELARRATSVTALDASPEMLQIAAARTAGANNIRFTQADLFTWTPDRRYPLRLLRLLAVPRAAGTLRRVLVDHRLRPHTGRPRDVH